MKQRHWFSMFSILVVLSLALAACGGSAATAPTKVGPTQPPAPAPTSAPAVKPTTAPAPTAAPVATTAPAGAPVEIRWYIGLGTGDAPELEAPQQAVVDGFNASHPNIHLTKEVVLYASAYESLATQVTSGNPPDIVGPVGV
jgi:ABC-type glycerol-3-phosphate transport system substrate-binding protein